MKTGSIDRVSTFPYQKTISEILNEYGLKDMSGLSSKQVTILRERFGANILPDSRSRGPIRIFLVQFTDFLVLVLIGAALVAGLLGEPQDFFAIATIIILNAVLGFAQEYRAEKALSALKQMTAPQARVRRDGETLLLPAEDLVPGDVIVLEAGNFIPADLRLVEVAELQVDESTFTGESLPVMKQVDVMHGDILPVPDRKNMAFKGTMVIGGRGLGIVTATGQGTELGKIAVLLREEVEIKTPLQRRLAQFARRLAVAVLFLSLLVMAIGISRGEDVLLMFMTALSLAVAAIPEALPAVVTVSLALGARAMSRKNALIRKLPAVEALGSVTYICTDKTGTLTENRMAVQQLFLGGCFRSRQDIKPSEPGQLGSASWSLLFQIMAQNNDAYGDENNAVQGDPTETALFRMAQEMGFDKGKCEIRKPRVAEVPFSSDRGMMSTIHQDGNHLLVFVKGAPERIFANCTHQLTQNGSVEPFDGEFLRIEVAKMAGQGLRVLAFAQRLVADRDVDAVLTSAESQLTFVGLVGLMDPPREEAKEALGLCQRAGIHVIMITGDHPETARSIGLQLGLIHSVRDRVITGMELDDMSEDDLTKLIRQVSIFARVAPEHKIRIVKSLQANGEVVAMTGDGVNDAPALRRSDIGVAMGKGGTDVAKEASHMILLDDNFATIVRAIREGRRIYDNIRKFVRFALSGNSAEIWTLLAAPLFFLPTPLLPIHILWINLVTDGLPGLALSVEPEERSLMARGPRRPSESIFSRGLGWHTIWVGILSAAVTLAVQAWSYHSGGHWQSMTFTVLTFVQMGHILAIRSEVDSIFRIGWLSNRPLLTAVAFTFVLQIMVLYVPSLNKVFKTVPLTATELIICILASSIVFFAVELEKWILRRP
jgi:Ca2+-transporting ATPase